MSRSAAAVNSVIKAYDVRGVVGEQIDEAFVAEVPELPGCMADGCTYEEALNNARVVIDEWIETALSLGREVPQPKGRLMFA